MRYRNLGATGLRVSELGLGCSSIGSSMFNLGDEDEFLKILNYAVENGINLYDTADTYAHGNSEALIGKAFKNRRDKVIISSKVGFLPSSLSSRAKHLVPILGKARRLILPFKKNLKKLSRKSQDFSEGHIINSIEHSLHRLKTDYLDIYLLHNPPQALIKEGEVFHILEKLKLQGKIRFYGVSAANIDDAVLCLNFPGVEVLQIEFNLLNQDAALKLFPLLGREQAGIMARVPLARGLLSVYGKVRTGSFSHDAKLNQKQKFFLEEYGKKLNKKIFPEAAVRFILEHPHVSGIIAGTKSLNHLKENIKIIENPSIDASKLKKIYENFSADQLTITDNK